MRDESLNQLVFTLHVARKIIGTIGKKLDSNEITLGQLKPETLKNDQNRITGRSF
jgi:hypothetical protein